MDFRWRPVSRDSQRDIRVVLHPTASITEIRRGLDPGSDDSVDLSPYVTQGTQTAFDVNVTLSFNRELFGDTQPKPNQVLEIQLWESGAWKPVWLGIVDAINGFTLQRGTRSLQLIAKSRDSQDIWRNTKRVTPLFPQLTNLTYMAERIARSAGLVSDEILLPVSAFTTAHSNTQLADMNAWDMISQIFVPLGWTPFIDCVGRLRAADRGLIGRRPDVVVEDGRLVKVGGQRQRPPKSRVRLFWLNPTLKKDKKQDRLLGNPVTITLGWFMPFYKQKVWFSDDKTQRAENTRIEWSKSNSVNVFVPFVDEDYIQQSENGGKLKFKNYNLVGVVALIGLWYAAHQQPDGVAGSVTVPVGRREEAIWQLAFSFLMMNVGTGTYQIWGTPFEWVHARNISEAFDSSVPTWVDNSVDIESDFIVNEEHAKATCIRELIYQAREANKWTISIVDDPRIEFGDILQFTDGSQIYVEDFSRKLERGSEAILDIKGFLIPPAKIVGEGRIAGAPPPPSGTAPVGGGGGAGGGGETGGGGGGGGDTEEPPQTCHPPNEFATVERINSENPGLLATNTTASCGQFTELVVNALHAQDPKWGHVGKVGGQTQYNGHAVDAIMHLDCTSRVVDIIGGAEGHPKPGSPAWIEATSGGQPWKAP